MMRQKPCFRFLCGLAFACLLGVVPAARAQAVEPLAEKAAAALRQHRDAGALRSIEAAQEALHKGAVEEARALADKAVETAPDFPAGYLARAAIERRSDLGRSILDLGAALKTIPRNTAWAVSLLGGILFILMWGVWGAITAYLFGLAGLKAPLLYHDAREGNKKRFYAAAFSLAGLLLGIIPALLVAGALMLPYLSRRERFPLIVVALWVVMSYWIVAWGGAFLAFPSSREAKAVVEVNEGRGNLYAIDILSQGKDWARGLTLGLALSRQGRLKEAIEVYEKVQSPTARQAARIKNNIANCWFRLGDVPRAMTAYTELTGSGLVTVLYNLSQANRELLRFDEGDRLFEQAQKLDGEAVGRFRETGQVVADETLSPMERIRVVAGAWKEQRSLVRNLFRPLVRGIPPVSLPVLGVVFFVIFTVAFRKKGGKPISAFRCRKCQDIVCPVCDSGGGGDGMCGPCSKAVNVGSSDDPSERVAKMINVRRRRDHQRNVLRSLCAVPGLSDLAAGRGGVAFLLLGLWVFFILLVLIPLPLAPFRGMEPMTELRVLGFVGLVILYVTNFLSVMRRISKGWL